MKIHISIAGFLLLVSAALQAQTTAQPQSSAQQSPPSAAVPSEERKIEPGKEADIHKLLDLTGAAGLMDQTLANMEKNIKPVMTNALPEGDYREQLVDLFFEKFRAKLDRQKLISLAVPIYDKYFTHEDIKGLIQFYQTPLGRKSSKVMPQLTGELTEAGRKMGEEVGRVSMMEVLAEHPELERAIEEAQKPRRP